MKLGHVSLDGTKMAGNASKHKANSHERMGKNERELKAEIAALIEEAERVDAEEDQRFGKDKRGDELPEELQRRQTRLEKIEEAKKALEAEAAIARAEHKRKLADKAEEKAQQAEQADREAAEKRAAKAEQAACKTAASAVEKAEERLDEATTEAEKLADSAETRAEHCQAAAAQRRREDAQRGLDRAERIGSREAETCQSPLPEHRVPFDCNGEPKPTAQRNFTDPQSKIMKSGTGEFLQGYNCQAAVDEEHQIIVAQAATNQANDNEHLPPLLDQTIENCGQPEKFTADAGYWSNSNAAYCEGKTDAFIATGRPKPGSQPEPTDARPEDPRSAMRAKLETDEGRATYARRKAITEPVFGQIKHAREFRRFLLRGLDMIRLEWALMCTGHNLLKLFHALRGAENVGATA